MDEDLALPKQGRASRRQGFVDYRWKKRKTGRLLLLLTFFSFGRQRKSKCAAWMLCRKVREDNFLFPQIFEKIWGSLRLRLILRHNRTTNVELTVGLSCKFRCRATIRSSSHTTYNATIDLQISGLQFIIFKLGA